LVDTEGIKPFYTSFGGTPGTDVIGASYFLAG
jgi:hypothetical protein